MNKKIAVLLLRFFYIKFDKIANTTGIVIIPIIFETKQILALSEESRPPASVNKMVFMPTGIAQIITGITNKSSRTPKTYNINAQTVAKNTRRTKETIYDNGLLKSSFNENLPKTKPVKSIVTALIQFDAATNVSLKKPIIVEPTDILSLV